jgi:hypothetical protein
LSDNGQADEAKTETAAEATVAGKGLRSSRGGTRTPDPVINSHLLYQLSYSGKRRNLRQRTSFRNCYPGAGLGRLSSAIKRTPPLMQGDQ